MRLQLWGPLLRPLLTAALFGLLLAAALAPQEGAAQTGPAATQTPAATEAAAATTPATVAVTVTSTATPTAPATATEATTGTPTAGATATPTAGATGTPTAPATGTPGAQATAAALAPLTATDTLAATPDAAPGAATATVRTSQGVRLRVRSGPGANYPIVARLANGQKVALLGQDATGKWLLVETGGGGSDFGWIAAAYAATSTPVAQLPVSSAISQAAPVTSTAVTAAAPVTGTAATAAAPVTGTTAAAVAPSPRAATPAPGNLPGKIAVPIFDPDRQVYNIWLVDANGTNLRLVVENASAPALSADGTLLAYRHWQRDDRGIVVANSDGANPLRLTDKLEDVLPSFAPDKTKIVFSTYRQGDRRSRIYYVWTDEQNRRAWEWGAGGLFGEDPDWLADGRIVFHASNSTGDASQLWIMNGDATNQRPFFTTSSIAALAAAPDSRTVAYMSNVDGNWDIYSVAIDGGSPRRLTSGAARDGLPAWSPDGQAIAFVSDRSGQWALWVMDADGGNERLLAFLPGPVDGQVQFEPDYLNHGWLEEQIAWSW